MLIASSDDAPDSERQLLQLFRARRCDALIVASCLPAGDDSYLQLQAKGIPIIAIDRVMDPARFCSVISDDRQASLQLTRSLLQTHPRQIALISARPELSISQERTAGFREALAGFEGQVLIEHGESFSRECGRQLMDEMLARLGHLPDALITTSYVLLQGVFDALHDFPLKSRPLRLGTFGDTQLLDFLPLPVNAMSQQHQLIAEKKPWSWPWRPSKTMTTSQACRPSRGRSSSVFTRAEASSGLMHGVDRYPYPPGFFQTLTRTARHCWPKAAPWACGKWWYWACTGTTGSGSGTWCKATRTCMPHWACTRCISISTDPTTWRYCASG
nr:hypothetical protein GCM10020185_20460 [Pseudomonas brassicacearum subsp. brassicacearum]